MRRVHGFGMIGVAALVAGGLFAPAAQQGASDPGVRKGSVESGKQAPAKRAAQLQDQSPWIAPTPWRRQSYWGAAGHPPERRGKKPYSAKLKAKRKARRRRQRAA